MQLINFRRNDSNALGYRVGDSVADLTEVGGPSSIDEVLAAGPDAMSGLDALSKSAKTIVPISEISEWLPPVLAPSKAIAIGLNYLDHAAEANHDVPNHPVIFTRYPSSWVAHNDAIIRPKVSKLFDYEGELAVIIGKPGRHIDKADALDYVAGYSIFNEGSVRDYQTRTHQWTIGKNFDRSGAFGPFFVSADELPKGASGLSIKTILNGDVIQDANTEDMIFDVATLVSSISEAMALTAGDLIISGTPAGIGAAYKPPIWMKPGDVCEVAIDGLGVLSNPVEDEV